MKPGNILEKHRKEKKWSLRQLGYKCGLSHTYIRDIETGVLQGTPETHEKIVEALGMPQAEREKFYSLMNEERPLPQFVQDKIRGLEEKIAKLEKKNDENLTEEVEEQLEIENTEEHTKEKDVEENFVEKYQLNEYEENEYNKIVNMCILMFNDEDLTEEAKDLLKDSLQKVFVKKLLEKRRKEGR